MRMVLKPDCISDEQKTRIKNILSTIEMDVNQTQMLELISNSDSWASTLGQSLLCGKFIGLLTGKYASCKLNVN